MSDLRELEVMAGENISRACEALAKAAPAFMVFNGTRVEAAAGDTPETLFRVWQADRAARVAESTVRCRICRADLHGEWWRFCPTCGQDIKPEQRAQLARGGL